MSAYPGLEILATAVLLLDRARTVVYANPAAENLFELSRKHLVGHAPGEVFANVACLDAAIDKAVAGGATYTEQELELGVTAKPKLHLTCTVSPVDVNDAALLLEFRHIDQQLKIAREERLLEQQQANRELIRSLAHEIKNPLGGIRGAAQLLERELDRPPLIEYTQVIIGEADRLQSLVNRLLTPHRLPTYRRTNIHEILVRVTGVVQAEFRQVAVLADFDTSLPEFEADPEQLTQAALNIVRNAAQALAGTTANPQIRLVTRVARYVTLAKRRYRLALALSIEDNGPGIPDTIRDRIFYPLVSGREGGTGLGLTLAQTFIAQHNGTIECESAPGRTVFTILLPLEIGRAGA
jgi:two-component system nitrogen regulation sensor histidine kinase GlnL